MTDRSPVRDAHTEELAILDFMFDASRRLPAGWMDGEFALTSAKDLATFIVEHRDVVDTASLGKILAAGGVLIATMLSRMLPAEETLQ